MTNAPATIPAEQNAAAIFETVMIKGDLAKLTPQERNEYYLATCRSIGLNPLTRPFDYIVLNGRMVLYARKDCTEQLRKLNGVSVEVLSRDMSDDLYTVHVRAKDKDGRTDEDLAAVAIGPLKGEARANAIMKCITKAKRRVTLSISGLGLLDESEVESVSQSAAPVSELKPVVVNNRYAFEADATSVVNCADRIALDLGEQELTVVTPENAVEKVSAFLDGMHAVSRREWRKANQPGLKALHDAHKPIWLKVKTIAEAPDPSEVAAEPASAAAE